MLCSAKKNALARAKNSAGMENFLAGEAAAENERRHRGAVNRGGISGADSSAIQSFGRKGNETAKVYGKTGIMSASEMGSTFDLVAFAL